MFARMAVALFGTLAWGAEEAHTVPYVPSASSEGHAGVVRIESRSAVPGEVRVVAVDDAGQRVEAGRLTLHARTAVEFEMAAMESGDASLGLAGTGRGEGDWRLELSTNLDIEARAYARSEGFATALHDATLLSGEVEFPLFHPGGDARRSVLRLANARGEPAAVSVRGVDDAGRAAGPVTVDLGAWEARGYAAEELESGSAAGLSGSLGDGAGNWRLFLEAERGSAYALNLLLDGSGTVSSVPGGMSRGSGVVHRVPLFPSAADGSGRRGVVRVVNRSAAAAEVSIEAFDATDRVYEELRLALEAESSAEFDSMDLEQGNAAKGLEGSTGSGEGDWWLELASESDIEVLSYVDGATGPLSAVRGTAGAETETGMRYEVVLLSGEASELRLLNAGGETVEVRVSGTDDAGSPGGEVELTLAPWTAGTLTTTALAEGSGVRGALGAGTGSWRLSLEADGEIDVLSLVRGAGGKLSDVSRRGRPAGAPPRTEVIDATALGADLWVAASASEAELSPGEAFDLRATVGNRGGDASATTLRYYRSADAVDHDNGRAGGDGCGGRAGGGGDQRRVTDGERADGGGHVLLRRVRGRGGGGDEHLEQLLGGGGGEGDGAAAAAGPGGDGGVGERSGAVARGGVRADGDGGQPGRRCLGDDAALLPLGRRVDHGGGRGGGDGCGGRAGGGGDQRRVTDAERADGAGHVLLRRVRGRGGGGRRVRGRGGGGDEHLEQLLGGGGGEGDGAAAAAGPGGDGGVGERSGVVAGGGVRADGDGGQPGRAMPRRRRCATTARPTRRSRRSRRRTHRWARTRWPRWRRGRPAPSH